MFGDVASVSMKGDLKGRRRNAASSDWVGREPASPSRGCASERTGYFGRSPATMAFSSFNSFSVAVSLLRLNSLTGKPGTTDHFLPSLRMGKELNQSGCGCP